MSRSLLFFMLSYFFGLGAIAQPKEIKFSELESVVTSKPKPVVIFLHTDWCSYCSLMERKTLKDQQVVHKLNSDFYYISFNAERDETITYRGKEYSLKKLGINTKQHELAKELAQSNAYPAMIFLNENLEVLYRHFAYVKPNDMYQLLKAIKPTSNDT